MFNDMDTMWKACNILLDIMLVVLPIMQAYAIYILVGLIKDTFFD